MLKHNLQEIPETPLPLPVLSCGKFLGLLEEFYRDLPDAPAIDAMLVAAGEIPEPQHRLLVHHRDMTSTLQRHYGTPVVLRVLDRKLARDWYFRHIVLETGPARQGVEYGAIRIFLPLLSEAARVEVLSAQSPLGGILNAHHLAYRSCPGAFFKIFSNAVINRSLQMDASDWLYGRCNCLTDNEGRAIADVVEILPPSKSNAQEVAP
jgi:hypothetical protein